MFESFLKQHDQAAWARAVEALLPDIHEVDRNAVQIWFHFFPLALAEAIAEIPDRAELERTLRLDGNYRLADQSDTSHWFLYGHRYWPQVKAAIIKRAESGTAPASLDLAAVVREIATDAGGDISLMLGIAAVGLMTLQQIGLTAFRAEQGPAGRPRQGYGAQAGHDVHKTPAQVLAARRRNDGQGIAGLWRGIRSQYTVTFDERRDDARFRVINQQHLTTASALDTRTHEPGPRTCMEGPIPVECRTASCGTCWVGVLGGAERLSDVETLEAKRMKEFGYINTTESKPLIRLACSALAAGNVSIVIPPWNGFIGTRTGFRETSGARRG
ncbi:MAG TPA: 2Fe-2S iron-sulfur cluster-binding protein [Vicinamibacterales bacterium]|nr:2Fe-2S iron-sulfur cluster-binding protein [Vicinamibacterales bacterium]